LEWDPSVLYHDFKEGDQRGDVPEIESFYDEFGDYEHCVIVLHLEYFQRQDGDILDDVIDQCVLDAQTSQVLHEPVFHDSHDTDLDMSKPEDAPISEYTPSGPKVTSKCDPDYNQLRPIFGWTNPDIIKKTFKHSTQYAHL
jgi:hypothetical protein